MSGTLVILPNNLGDVIMTLPLLAGLKAKDPQTHITFFVEQGFEAGLVNSPFCDRLFPFDRKAIRDRSRTAGWQEALDRFTGVVAELKALRFDRVINLSQHPYTSLLTTLVECENTAGRRFQREGNHALPDAWSQYLYAVPFARACNGLHATDVYCRIAGTTAPSASPVVRVTPDEKNEAAGFLSQNGMVPGAGPVMVLQPGAAYAAKRWPLDHFTGLGRMLVGDGYRIIITGAPAERELAEALGSRIGGAALVSAGKRTFRETIALMPFVQGCVTGDTAIMHAAAALDRRVYALFGPTNPVETGPYGAGHFVFYGRCEKRPCFCMTCKNTLCMKSILPETVGAVIAGKVPAGAGCDVFVSGRNSDATQRLDPVAAQGQELFSPIDALVARRTVEPDHAAEGPIDPEEADRIRREAAVFCSTLDRMIDALTEYLSTRSMEAIRRYERIHAEFSSPSGSIAFFSALLNIRLNSIPLIDPVKGVGASREACIATRAAVERAAASFG
ncbi:MAG: glycosyltransferase family 9 protein [Chitinispirillaceae bacterium]|nr:glycosyltransferase family 9 protein [Chitinispirillaceae bacterium]